MIRAPFIVETVILDYGRPYVMVNAWGIVRTIYLKRSALKRSALIANIEQGPARDTMVGPRQIPANIIREIAFRWGYRTVDGFLTRRGPLIELGERFVK